LGVMADTKKKRGVENFKVILLGNTFVGKTCIFERITRGEYNENI